MFRLTLLTACLVEKLSTARKRLLSAVERSAQIGAVVALVGSIGGSVEQRGQCRHTALQKIDCRPSIDQFGDEAGELGGCEFVIMLIILGVVARSGYGSGRFGSCHANVERVTTKTGRRQLPPGSTPAARANEGTMEVAPRIVLGAQRQGGGRRVVYPDRRRAGQARRRG